MAPPAKSVSSERAVADEGRSNDSDGSAIDQTDSLAVGEFVYQSLDPLDPRKVALNMFELYCHELITTPSVSRRAFLIDEMRVSRIFDFAVRMGELADRGDLYGTQTKPVSSHFFSLLLIAELSILSEGSFNTSMITVACSIARVSQTWWHVSAPDMPMRCPKRPREVASRASFLIV